MKIKELEGVTIPDYIINEIKKEVITKRDPYECKKIYGLALIASTMSGAMAEVGVYQGGSAKLICEAKGLQQLHLFDTFEGLPPFGPEDIGIKDINDYKASLESVESHLKGYKDVYYHKGVFPEFDGVSVEDTTFSFVHVDVDLYQSMVDCLHFFYPRMGAGGMMLLTGYPTSVGIKKAINDFFYARAEPITQLGYRQCLIVKQ